jgi:hypothetical protein
MSNVYDQMAKHNSLPEIIKGLIASPCQTLVQEIMGTATAALQPIATILKNSQDDYEALFTGIYPAKGGWMDLLTATQNGATIELAELR